MVIKRSDEQWQALFAEQAQSGLSAATFCKEQKLCPKYFSLRRKQLSGEKPKALKQKAFIQAQPKVSPMIPAVKLRYRNIELTLSSASTDMLVSLMAKLP